MKKRVLSALLALCMACGLVSTAWAADGQATPETAAEPQSAPVEVTIATPESAAPAEDPAPAQTPAGTVAYTAVAEQEGQPVNVIVDVPVGAFDETVTPVLHADAVSQAEADQAAETVADQTGAAFDGMMVLDVYFTDGDNTEEIEPALPVSVRFELPEAIVDSSIDLSTLAVQHLVEDEAGNVTTVEQVASVAEGGITLSESAQAALAAQANEEAGVASMSDVAADSTTETAEAAVVAEFEVESFSTFVLTYDEERITVQVVDSNYNTIGVSDPDLSKYAVSSAWTSTKEIAQEIMEANNLSEDSYSFDHAEMRSYYGGSTTFNWVKYSNNGNSFSRGFKYSTNQDRPSSRHNGKALNDNYGRQIYFVFNVEVELQTVETVDSTSAGVHMYMFNYDSPAYSIDGGGYGNGETKEGLASLTTDENGWPSLRINTDVYGNFALYGSIFMSSMNARDLSDSYTLIYGHHMDNGGMFGDVVEFVNTDYFESHPTGTLYLPDATYTIEIFACVQVDAFDSMIYDPTAQPQGDVSELLNYVDEIAVQSRYIGVTPQDKVIALSTCAEAETNGRVVIFGRLDRMS